MINEPIRAGDHRGLAIVFVFAVGILVVLFNVGSSKTTGTPATSSATVATTAPASVAGSAQPVTTISAAPVPPTPADTETDQTFTPAIVTKVVQVIEVATNGDLDVIDTSDADRSFTVSMSSKPKIVNLDNKEVSKDLLQVGVTVQVTGMLTGSTIDAQTVVIPTK